MNQTMNSSVEYGGLIYFLKYLSACLPYTLLSVFAAIVGTFGNLLIIGTILFNKKLYSATNILVVNQATSDLMVSFLSNTFTIVGVFAGEKYFIKNSELCSFIASISLICYECSVICMILLAFNRYILILYNHLYDGFFSKNATILYCILAWIVGLLVDIPNYIGWGGRYYDHASLNCVWNRLISHSYVYFIFIVSVVIPALLFFFFYLSIFIKIENHSSKPMKVTKGLFAICIIYLACSIPFEIVLLNNFADELHMTSIMYSMTPMRFNFLFNPILYALTNVRIKKGYVEFFRLIFGAKIPYRIAETGLTASTKV